MKKLLALSILLISSPTYAAVYAGYVSGEVYDITAVQSGLLIRVKDSSATNIVPTNCQNPSSAGWLLIPEEHKTMISVALAMRAQGKRTASIYVNPTTGGYCDVIQYDPSDNN